MIKKLLKLKVKKYIFEAFKKAESVCRHDNGVYKLEYALEYIATKIYLLPCFKNMLKEILKEEFREHAEYINKMIIRERIKI